MKEERINKEKLYKQQLIVEAAEMLFFKKGIKETSMDEIAKESGFTKKTLYRYFQSKDDIYYEVMYRSYNKLNEFLKEKVEKVNEESAILKLKNIQKAIYMFNEEHSNELRIIFDFNNTNIKDIQQNETAMKCYKEGEYVTNLVLDALKKGMENGEIKENIDIKKIFVAVWSNIMGMINLINFKEEYIKEYFNIGIYESIEYYFDLIIKSIRKEG